MRQPHSIYLYMINKIISGVNDIYTTDPQIAKLFKDPNIPFLHSRNSKEEATFICPDCKSEITKKINTVCKHGLNCSCGDSWSYPNKFIYSFLHQLNLRHFPEKSFTWSDSKKYDEYVMYKDKSIIIEMHGNQHYAEKRGKFHNRSLEEEQSNDRYKRKLAMNSGEIDFYFEIDARESTLAFIKQSLVNSGLLECLEIFEDDIDWFQCDKFATNNICKMICDDYKSYQNVDIEALAKKWSLNIRTIRKYLNKGNTLGWCNYIPYSNKVKNLRNHSDAVRKKVFCKTIDKEFKSATEAAKYLDLPDAKNNGRSIRNSIKFNRPYLGYEFEYVI